MPRERPMGNTGLQVLHSMEKFILAIVPCLVILVPVRFRTDIPDYIFRKLLHILAFSLTAFLIVSAESLPAAIAVQLLIPALAYPVLTAVEHRRWYAGLFVEKRPGEIKRSLWYLFGMTAAVTLIAWGVFGRREIAVASILMWGTGDGMAALIGIPYGKHKVKTGPAAGKKSWEGTAAMFGTAFTVGMILFGAVCGYPCRHVFMLSAAGAAAGAAAEMYSPGELDTVVVPAVIVTVLLVLSAFII